MIYLATLSDGSDNWKICQEEQLWGTRQSPMAKSHGKDVRPGDIIYVRQAPDVGVFAKCIVTTGSVQLGKGSVVRWPEPETYSNVFGIKILQEIPPVWNEIIKRISIEHGNQNNFFRIEDPVRVLVLENLFLEF